MAAEALKLMGDLKVAMDALGLQLSDASTALQDEKTASYSEGVLAGKSEVGQAQPQAPLFTSEDIEAAKAAAKAEAVAAGAVELGKLQVKYDALVAAVKVEIDDAKTDTARLEAAVAPVIVPVEAPVEGEKPVDQPQA